MAASDASSEDDEDAQSPKSPSPNADDDKEIGDDHLESPVKTKVASSEARKGSHVSVD